MSKAMALDFEMLNDLQELWSEKKWEFPTIEQSQLAFDAFCAMISQLSSKDEQKFVLALTKSYKRYSLNSYSLMLIKALRSIEDCDLVGIRNIVFAPLINPSDEHIGKSKSGQALPYIAEHVAAPLTEKFNGLVISAISTPTALPPILNSSETLLILLDDFIGSGDTAKNAVWGLIDKPVTNKVKYLVVVVAAMRNAIDFLGGYNINVRCGDVLTKGIAENEFFVDKAIAYSLVDAIEAELDVGFDYRRGYKRSEALVSMLRTPDNTFPMYWCKKRVNDRVWSAPFPR